MAITRDAKKDALVQSSFVLFLSCTPPLFVKTMRGTPHYYGQAHYHDYPEIWYCHSGHYTHKTENGSYNCSAGTVVIIPPGTMHLIDIPRASDVRLTQIATTYNFFENADSALYIDAITHLLLPNFSNELGFSFPEAVTLSEKSRIAAETLIKNFTENDLEVFFSLPEFSLTAEQKKYAIKVFNKYLRPILHALTYMNSNYAHKITCENLTDVSSLCRTNFFSLFKRYLGISYSTYLIMLRVLRANFAIAHTPYSFSYISDMCGFSTSSHMTKCYKKYKGFLPKRDRANLNLYREKYPDIHISHSYFDNI